MSRNIKKITRIWHGVTNAIHADEYLKYVEDTGMKEYRRIKGNLSAKLLRSIDGNQCHFLTVTEWDSYESIKKFAGDDYQKAKYYEEDGKYLLEFEEHVVHYETFEY
jgi:heme-degrading monooxygenase HmoA